MLSWILDHQNKPGMTREVLDRLAMAEGRTLTQSGGPSNGYDVEVMKFTLEQLCAEAKVRIQLHTRVCAALKDRQGRLTHVITESKSGREAFAGSKQQDAVCQVTYPINLRATDSKKEKGIEKAGFRAKPYDIPLRALIAKDVTGLMMAGRCISGDFLAHSSYRVTGNAVAMGEAAGKVAAVAATIQRTPQKVAVAAWKGRLP
jgi:hypothetical protein